MNEGTNKGPTHPAPAEFADAALTLASDLLVRLQAEAAERYPDWCPAVRTQACYEAACLHLGMLDGHAMCGGITRAALDRSLRTGMRVGRELALKRHRDGGCDGCKTSAALEQILAAN